MQRDIEEALAAQAGMETTSILSVTNTYVKATEAKCDAEGPVDNGDQVFLHDNNDGVKQYKATTASGVLSYKLCDNAACSTAANAPTLDDALAKYEIALSACSHISTCTGVSCTGADPTCTAQKNTCTAAQTGDAAEDVLFLQNGAQLAAPALVTNHYIEITGAVCKTAGAGVATVASADSGKGAVINWDHNTDTADATKDMKVLITSGAFVISDPETIAVADPTDVSKVKTLCAAACDQHDDCDFFELVGTNKDTWGCKPYSDCELEASATATNLVFVKDSGAVRYPTDTSSLEWNVKNNFKCDSGGTDAADAGSTDVTYDGTTHKFAVSSSLFDFTTITLTNANQHRLCTAACEVLTDSLCKGVEMTGVDSKENVQCKALSACTAVLDDSSITGTTSLGVSGRSIYSLSANGNVYTKTTSAVCAASDYATQDDSGTAFTYAGMTATDYKAKVSNVGVMTFWKGTAGTATPIEDIVWSNGLTDAQNHLPLCIAACEQLNNCNSVAADITAAGEACTAFNICKLTADSDPENVVLTNHGENPTYAPTEAPSKGPTLGPSAAPTKGPSAGPSKGPSQGPSGAPSKGPSAGPSSGPSVTPSAPTPGPTHGPSKGPAVPTVSPSGPTSDPTPAPSKPTENPTVAPSKPTPFPSRPTNAPIVDPTPAPSQPTPAPTRPTPAPTQPTPAPVKVQTADVETTSASSTIMALQVVVFLAWALF